MTDRERFLEALLFGRPDKVPFTPGWPRESTLKAWCEQGLPQADSTPSASSGQAGSPRADWQRAMLEEIGVEHPPASGPSVWIRHAMIPEFEEKVLEEREDSLIVQDWKGNVCEISKKYDVSYLRLAKDFVTRRWIRCPVENRDDWEAMKARYDPDDPNRIPEDIADLGRKLADRSYVARIGVQGPFWQMREWLGFENLCAAFLDDPELIRDMVGFWTDYVSRLLLKVVPHVALDCFHISEDMAYKEKAMISPDMAREFLGPCWRQWGEIVKSSGCPLYDVDSDGFIGELIPVWIECGINVCDPIEVAAGNDINELRRAFGRQMAFCGGVDKRAMAKGGSAIREELARVEPVLRDGGYIPGCDHAVPPDVSWPDYLDYCDLLARMTGWK